MQSHLTRRVFRAILNNEPLSSSHCRHRLPHTLRRTYNVQRRSLFSFPVNPPTRPATATLPSEVGLKPMRDLSRALQDKSRGPSTGVLARAFNDFFVARVETPGLITGFQARLLIVTWKHLRAQEAELEPEEWQQVFATDQLQSILFVLSEAKCLPESREVIQRLARYAFLELCADHGFGPNQIDRPALLAYINIQALNGNPEGARHVVEKFWDKLRKTTPSPWLTVMKGFAMNNDRRWLQRTAEKLEDYGIQFDPASHEALVNILIKQDLPTAVHAIYECPLSKGQEPTLATKEAAIKYAILKSDTAWAEPILESFSQAPITETIQILLLWEAAHGKNAAQLSDRVQALTAGNPSAKASLNIACVNSLMEYANCIKNPQLASEFAALASKWGLQPDAQTHQLRLESYIQAGDVHKTVQAIEKMYDINLLTLKNLPLVNKLITMLCFSGQDDALFDRVSAFLDPVFDNNIRLKAETLAAVTHLLLYRHDWEGVSELLRPRLSLYDDEERTKIRNALTGFITDPTQESNGAWEAYGLLQLAFPETGVSMRTDIMTSFFKRHRSDLAFLVFGHMRQAEDFARRPKPDTYARCFQGLARTQDAKNVDLVHNMLKLDVEVDLNTRLLDGLMLAYAACDMPEKSMEVFREILQSEEGPSHKTIYIFFKLCEKHHNGVQEAMKMISKVKLLEITVDRRLYMAYVEALAAQCEFDLATEAVDQMYSEIGCLPNRNSIGLLYNAIPYQYWKDEIEKWAKVNYPEQWAELEGIERTDYEEGQKFALNVPEITIV